MLRPKLADLAREAKKIKTAPIKAAAGSGGKQQQRPRPGGLAHFRVLESPGCRRVVLTGPTGRLDGKAAESLTWKMRAWENNYLVKAVILHGRREGKFYSGGWEHGHSAAGPEGQHQTRLQALQRYSQLAYLLATLSKPTIAWLNGEVRGSGLGLGLARLRVATRSSSFHVDAAKRGWALDGGLSFALPRLRAGADGSVVGGPASLALARYLALTGGVLKGADMLACGMATHMMDDAAAAAIHKRCVLVFWYWVCVLCVCVSRWICVPVTDLLTPHPFLLCLQAGGPDVRAGPHGGGGAVGARHRVLQDGRPPQPGPVPRPVGRVGPQRRGARAVSYGCGCVRVWPGVVVSMVITKRYDGYTNRMMRAAAGDGASVGGGGAIFADEEGEDADDEGENPLGADDEEESGWVRQKEEAEAAVGEEEELGMGEGLHAKLDMKQMLARQGLLEEDDAAGGERGRGRGGKQQQQRAADSEMEGSLWWHRNFAPGDEALMRAQAEIIE